MKPSIKRTISLDYVWGDTVFLKTDREYERIVTGVIIRPGGKMYELACGVETSWHQSIEIEKAVQKAAVRGFGKK